MRDLARFAERLPTVCPRLRQIRISATYFGLWVCEIGGGPSLYSSTWTEDTIRRSKWFKSIRPLSGLVDASINFSSTGFHDNCFYTLREQQNIRTNTALVQFVFKQSATRPCEAPSDPCPLLARGLLHGLPPGDIDTNHIERRA